MTNDEAPREIEAKFEVDEAGRQTVLELERIGAFDVRARRPRTQNDLYFDTAGADLANAGSTLRVRRWADGAVVTFKGQREAQTGADDAHLANRAEDEVPISGDLATLVSEDAPLPAEIDVSPVQRARALVGDKELRPVALLLNERVIIELADASGQQLEMGVDRVVGTRFSDRRVVEFEEIELEAKGVERAVLLETQRAMQALIPALRPSQTTKLERVLGRDYA